MSGPEGNHRVFHLLDVAALIVGYSLASLLIRAFWPTTEVPSVIAFFVLALAFLWLGLAMSGPIVLLGHRRGVVDPESDLLPPRSWAELAWLIIGFYWIALTILVVPARSHTNAVTDSAFLGLFPVVAAVGLRFVRPRKVSASAGQPDWTHRASIVLLVTWPFAWVAMILLGKSLP